MDENSMKGRGGYRPGAGRKKLYEGGKKFAFNTDAATAQVIEGQPDHTAFINRCIQEYIREERHSSMPQLLPRYEVRVACGAPTEVPADAMEMVDALTLLCGDPETSYVLETRGDSMIDADIHSGDYIVVDSSRLEPTNRYPMLCQYNGGYTVKFVEKQGHGYVLIPANEAFAPIVVEPDSDFAIWGTVVSVVHRFGG